MEPETFRKEILSPGSKSTDSMTDEVEESTEYQVLGSATSYNVTMLEPFTLYEVSMVAWNRNGESLPTYKLKVLTHQQGDVGWKQLTPDESALPPRPDVRSCCIARNVSHASCVEAFCDTHAVTRIQIPDLMICAPWSKTMFGCLFDGRDESACCEEADVPEACRPMCSGSIGEVDYTHFQ